MEAIAPGTDRGNETSGMVLSPGVGVCGRGPEGFPMWNIADEQ